MGIMFGGMTKSGSGRGFGRSYSDQVYKYRLEVSMDGENFTTVLDRTDNTVSRNTIFEEFEPVECRFVKLTVTSWPLRWHWQRNWPAHFNYKDCRNAVLFTFQSVPSRPNCLKIRPQF